MHISRTKIASKLTVALLASTLTACGSSSDNSTVQEEHDKVTQARKVISDAGFETETELFWEYTCKSKQPFASKTYWRSIQLADGGKKTADGISEAYASQGWTALSGAWTSGVSSGGKDYDPETFYSVNYTLNDATVSVNIFRKNPNRTEVLTTTTCKDQPADRELEKDPEHPEAY
ncbi:hypothetical protein [Galactobacter caseinivorans]|uniref:hypothetical protein n=1 Tax=Galactobacter caseinivorans TaxID=2676123 RepID=UPI0011C3AB0C|nr:hypothetical protein [Galactobacter caseinivorans]